MDQVAQPSVKDLQKSFIYHLQHTLVKDKYSATKADMYLALAYAVRDLLATRWLDTQQSYYLKDAKRVYYISMEFLMGRTLGNALINLGVMEEWDMALKELGLSIEELQEVEWDAGLGNGGLGRLAACFLDSMASMQLPAYGYGIRYEYGMFYQKIVDGGQHEVPDNWLRYQNPWEFDRQEHLHPIRFEGRVVEFTDRDGSKRFSWVDYYEVMALAYDFPVPGYKNNTVNTMRLWSAKASRDFDLNFFNQGNYIGSVESKMKTENISKVLYPADHMLEGKELRLRQEYFLASATVQDILYRFAKKHDNLTELPDQVAIQLNDTHPVLAIPELMRILIDERKLTWEAAWEITTKTFAYTNHTILQEALEKWPVPMVSRLLPRHLLIIFEINRRFLEEVASRFPGDTARLQRMSIIDDSGEKQVRMAHLAIVASHSINGVSALHSEILKDDLFHDFYEVWPERFNNKTNGITQRRWLKHCNPYLADLISEAIGDKWTTDLDELQNLRPLAEDSEFRRRWMDIKRMNKQRLADHIYQRNCIQISPDSLFDCQTKRIHEYKRQLLNILQVVARYNRLKEYPGLELPPRTVIFGGKAAPSYSAAKLIIKLINSVGSVINNDPAVNQQLKVAFLANYSVSLAEKIFPAADLSEQISTAGTEASGTGNMKYALNGALTIGTLDGANIEIMEEVGKDNIFIFGLTTPQAVGLRSSGYRPQDYYYQLPELKTVLDQISSGMFSPGNPGLFRPLVDNLLNSDYYLLLADFDAYMDAQADVDRLYMIPDEWARKSILNTAGMGKFSSDRTIGEYARDIWGIKPQPVEHKGIHHW
ncbi:glycogen/starch/alpha-glucan phosphorylase [Trichlorobacter lovleyi]|uniref:Alpha-1,4 glucan phosphorylase n=1 Tax=Trichlorobacter lovleyi (strain ATCC BAA-1151 / DSM 17278 / SZ) TaxID=398767 RepID=B3E5Y1_TRIL1|nr:glycogen/starch/alpha-glucan phosphorylase [Trichlorobacter lovleyi]ACD96222.1 glycogen/starch/alpha-glucan phosphorylase [Trichlorobacter lovleyi SZ]